MALLMPTKNTQSQRVGSTHPLGVFNLIHFIFIYFIWETILKLHPVAPYISVSVIQHHYNNVNATTFQNCLRTKKKFLFVLIEYYIYAPKLTRRLSWSCFSISEKYTDDEGNEEE